MLRELAENVVFHVINWKSSSSEPGGAAPTQDYAETDSLDEAHIVSSLRYKRTLNGETLHSVVLDIDHDAELVRSTNGNSHLFVDIDCKWDDYQAFLYAAAKIGLLEEGYVHASAARGFTAVRLPWVEKPKAG